MRWLTASASKDRALERRSNIVSSRVVVAVLALILAGTAHAQQSHEAEDALGAAGHRAAKVAFEQGRRAFDAGRYEEALERFEQAYELSDRPELLFDVGLAADRLREDARALSAFERYLDEAVDPEHRVQVEQRVAALRAARSRAEWREREQDRAARAAVPPPADVARAAARNSTADDASRSAGGARDRGPARDLGDEEDGGLLSQWWFWAGAAALVAGGAVTVYVLTRPGDDPALPEPNTGVVVPTLRLAP